MEEDVGDVQRNPSGGGGSIGVGRLVVGGCSLVGTNRWGRLRSEEEESV